MIQLNIKNGRLDVDSFFISPELTLNEFKALSGVVDIEKIVENGSYTSFGIKGLMIIAQL